MESKSRKHIMSHHIAIDLEMNYQFNSIGVNLTKILELNKEQTERFVKFAEKKLGSNNAGIRLIKIREKFQLREISQHLGFLQKINRFEMKKLSQRISLKDQWISCKKSMDFV